MAEKHTSKYKAPKDIEKSQKPKPRKDLKDYTVEDKDKKMNPTSTGEKQKNVLRKTDKEVIDNGSLVPDMSDSDRAYKADGKHDSKHAAKVMSKRQDDDEKNSKDSIKDKIENLTREQKERLVREMIRKKIKNVLKEQSSFSDNLTQVNDNLKQATEDARRISKEEGVTQHVNHIGKGRFDISDWYDSDNTVISFENGRRINESIKEQSDKAPEEETTPKPEAPAKEPTPAPAPAPAPAKTPEAPAPEPEAPAAEPEAPEEPTAPEEPASQSSSSGNNNPAETKYIQYLQTVADSPKQMVSAILRLGLKVSAEFDSTSKRNFFLQIKLLADRIYRDTEQFKK